MCIVAAELDFGELFSRGSGGGSLVVVGHGGGGLGEGLIMDGWRYFLFLENWAAVTDGGAEVVCCI